MAELKDSGNRREFKTGAVRDMHEGKGRMDLVPWGIALGIRETMDDLFHIRHYGYEVCNGKYQAVSAYQCIGPIVEYIHQNGGNLYYVPADGAGSYEWSKWLQSSVV